MCVGLNQGLVIWCYLESDVAKIDISKIQKYFKSREYPINQLYLTEK